MYFFINKENDLQYIYTLNYYSQIILTNCYYCIIALNGFLVGIKY